MNKLKTVIAGAMTAAMILSMTACDEEIAPSGSSGSNAGGAPNASNAGGAPASSVQTTTYDTDPAVQEAAKQAITELDDPDIEVTKRIKWMAWWDIDETTANAELFKEVYGIPATGDDPKREGKIFEYLFVPYLERYEKLSLAINSGDSPDLFPFEIRDFPYGAYKGRYQPVDDLLNLDSPKWDVARDIMDQFVVNDKHYCALYEISFNSLLYYRKSVVEGAGLEDPRELFEKDEWTWDAFLDMARKFQQSGENKFLCEGFPTEAELLVTTGTPLIGYSNNQLINNMNDANVQRAMDLLQTLQSENLRWPIQENGWSLNPKLWAQGDILFYADGGTWTFEETLTKFGDRFSWPEDEICVVTYPRDPQADKYYHNMKQDALMWCKGSENPNGVKAWIDCCITTALDPKIKAASLQQSKDKFKWRDYNLDFILSNASLNGSSRITPIFDFKNGIGSDIADAGKAESPVECLTKTVFLSGEKTYTQLKEENFAQIDNRINELNKSLGSI